ncbi:MAG: murein biosynthesis integral membrane protein MurJ [Polyangiaceae bacterium]|nr:murein biosynthesis integral membrane protein MurJ [Polyangiaceae bacterium]
MSSSPKPADGALDASLLVAEAATDTPLGELAATPPPPPPAGRGASEAHARARDARSATLVAVGILLSRLVGVVRQRVTAHYFGTSMMGDVVSAAFRVGNLAQNLLGEGTLSASFIPVYARLRGAGEGDKAARFAHGALGALMLVVAVVSLLGIAFAPQLSFVVAAGFDASKLDETAALVRLVFPMTGLLVLAAWGLGVLNAHRRFFLSYASPVVWSAAQIAALVVAAHFFGRREGALAQALGWGALAGAGLVLVMMLWAARRMLGGRLRPRLDFKDPALREAARRLPAVLLGRGVIQISGLVDTLLVSFLGTGANAAFGYAQALYLLPMSVLGTGEAAVALPELARESAEPDPQKRNDAIRRRLVTALGRVAVLSIPTVVALVGCGTEIVTLVLQTGAFDRTSTELVASVLAVYGCALLGNATGRLFSSACFALGDARRPARYAVVRVATSTAIALALMMPLGVVGVVVGAMTAAWVECILLTVALRRTLGGLGLATLPFRRLALVALCSALPPLALKLLLPPSLPDLVRAGLVLGALGLGFLAAAQLFGAFDLRRLLRRR